MLNFLRKHQRYFFAVITIVIIISFSFFGTYGTLETDFSPEQTVFTTINGTNVKRHELEDLALFIGTDMQDKLILGGSWGPNFLNDGVIRKDFLESGIGLILAQNYSNELLQDLKSRTEKERRFKLYSNPQAGFINVESAWKYFAPDMKNNYDQLILTMNPIDAEALASRISLFLQEKQFPAPLLKQVLRYQEQQYPWLPTDENLAYMDLSLFGYHTLEDWFGPRFVRLVAQFIMNSAKVAEQKGYKVTKEEVLADLLQHAATSYKQNQNNPNIGVATMQQYFDEQLRRMNMDQNKAIKIWRDVLLFRRLFGDVGNSVVVDPFSIEKMQGYAKESVQGQLFELPEDLRLNSYRSLQKLEIYLNAVANRSQDEQALLALPNSYKSLDEVQKKYPELIQHRYVLEVAQVNKNALQTRVGVKETWSWEVDDKNWEVLKKKFPELGVKKGETRDERFASLESLDDKTRSQIDTFARTQIVEAHPEWIDQALDKTPSKIDEISILEKGGKTTLTNGEKRQEVLQLLDKASLKGEPVNDSAKGLLKYTPDNNIYYKIVVIKRSPGAEIMTFSEAEAQGVLDQLLDKELEVQYVKMRERDPSQYKKPDGSWKSLDDVRDQVADQYFSKVRSAIEKDYTASIAPEKPPIVFLGDFLASLRLYSYMRKVRDELAKDSNNIQKWVMPEPEDKQSGELSKRASLQEQWKLIQTPYQGNRSDIHSDFNAKEIFAMNVGSWSKVNTPVNGDLNFFHMEKREAPNDTAEMTKVNQLYRIAASDAQRIYAQKLLGQLKDKKALSVDYMNRD